MARSEDEARPSKQRGTKMDLHTYYLSNSCDRVHSTRALKGLDCGFVLANLIGNGGEHRLPAFQRAHPDVQPDTPVT